MPVPCSYNDVLSDKAVHDHVGDVWYQRVVQVPRGWERDRVVLRFDAATHRATVWVDETQVVEHEGGYTPFEVDISDLVREDREMRVTVAVNNELTWQSLPPGIVKVMPDGERRQRQYHDFFNYAGLHRSVWLYSTPTDLHRRPDRRDRARLADGSRTKRGVRGRSTKSWLCGWNSATMQTICSSPKSKERDAVLTVPNAQLWEPGRGYLYRLQSGPGRTTTRTRCRSLLDSCRDTHSVVSTDPVSDQ